MAGPRDTPWSRLRPAHPYLITAVLLGLVGLGGYALAEALQINYLSTFLALGGVGLALVGLLFLLIGVVVGVVALLRGRSG